MKLMMTVKDIDTNETRDVIFETANNKGDVRMWLNGTGVYVPLEEIIHILELFKAEEK